MGIPQKHTNPFTGAIFELDSAQSSLHYIEQSNLSDELFISERFKCVAHAIAHLQQARTEIARGYLWLGRGDWDSKFQEFSKMLWRDITTAEEVAKDYPDTLDI